MFALSVPALHSFLQTSNNNDSNSASSVPNTVLWPWGTLSLQGGAAYPGATRAPLSLGALSSLGRPVTPSPFQQVLPALLSIIPRPLSELHPPKCVYLLSEGGEQPSSMSQG